MSTPASVSNSLHCSFCGKSQAEAKTIVAGLKANICGECVGTQIHSSNDVPLFSAQHFTCGFCGKQFQEVEAVSGRNHERICNDCLEVCREIIGASV